MKLPNIFENIFAARVERCGILFNGQGNICPLTLRDPGDHQINPEMIANDPRLILPLFYPKTLTI